MLKALHSHFNDSDIDLTFNDISIKNCTPDIGNGFGFQGTNTFGGFSRKVFNAEIQTITNKLRS